MSSVFLMLTFSLSLPCRPVLVFFSRDYLLPASFLISSTIWPTLEVKNDHKLWLVGWEEKARNVWEECNKTGEERLQGSITGVYWLNLKSIKLQYERKTPPDQLQLQEKKKPFPVINMVKHIFQFTGNKMC